MNKPVNRRPRQYFGRDNSKRKASSHQHMIDQIKLRTQRDDIIRPDEERFIFRRIPLLNEQS